MHLICTQELCFPINAQGAAECINGKQSLIARANLMHKYPGKYDINVLLLVSLSSALMLVSLGSLFFELCSISLGTVQYRYCAQKL